MVRRSGGQSRRVNSVNCVSSGRFKLEAKVERCEALFRQWQQRSVFRITPLAEPELDDLLAKRGYILEAPTSVQTSEVRDSGRDPLIQLCDRFDPDWVQVSAKFRQLDPEEARVLALQHAAIAVPSVWATAVVDGQVAGVGVAAIERGWVGIHGISVSKDFRRRGLARQISVSLVSEGYRQGAELAWLQVEAGNVAALSLYSLIGFQTQYEYHHRVKGDAERHGSPETNATRSLTP